MISLLHLNKLKSLLFFLVFLCIGFAQAEEDAIDLWDDNETKINESEKNGVEKNTSIESPILSEDVNKVAIKIEECSVKKFLLIIGDLNTVSKTITYTIISIKKLFNISLI